MSSNYSIYLRFFNDAGPLRLMASSYSALHLPTNLEYDLAATLRQKRNVQLLSL